MSQILHMCKVAVGARDLTHLARIQAERLESDPPLCHRTRNFPRRAAEIEAGGSLYWVVGGLMMVRQRILRIAEDAWPGGGACTGLFLDRALVPVAARPMKPFQGWRYLEPAAAPADLADNGTATGVDQLPVALRQALHALCLL